MNVRTTILSLTLLAAASLPLRAQPIIEPITQNPDAVLLRRIWTLTGSDGDRVGDDCGPVGDINGDSITDFAVHFGDQRRWRVYLGGSPAPTTEPVWILDSSVAVPGYPVYGDFFGDKKLTVGFGSFVDVNNGSSYSYQLRLFASMAGSLSDEEFAILDPYSRNKSELIYPATIQVANLDQELGDELLLAMSSMYKGGEYSQYPEIWLYRGGSGFTVDTPSYVIRDGEATIGDQFYTAKVMDLDGDRYMDLVTVGQYAEGYKLKMWFGTETSPWTWTTPDREVLFTSESGISFFISIGLFDGDSKLDFVSHSSSSDKSVRGVYLYLTRNGFNPRTSSFDRENASKVFLDSTIFWTSSFAHLNDSLRRVDMLGAFRRLQDADRAIALSGQGNGMNSQFDAFYSTQESGLSSGFAFNTIQPLIDCTGDGWEDLIVGHQNWPDNSAGIAMILAGGPYIPLDDPTVGVRTEPMANHERGLYLWPNPATTELNIAWRGDLAAMPARFAVHDITGTMITENEVRPGLGTARWSTAGVASGTYLLTAYDRSGNIIASVQIAVAH